MQIFSNFIIITDRFIASGAAVRFRKFYFLELCRYKRLQLNYVPLTLLECFHPMCSFPSTCMYPVECHFWQSFIFHSVQSLILISCFVSSKVVCGTFIVTVILLFRNLSSPDILYDLLCASILTL